MLIKQKNITLTLIWVKPHLDSGKFLVHGPDHVFLLKHFADHFAGIEAEKHQVPYSVAIAVLYYASLVKKIQLRIVSAIFACKVLFP